LFGVIIRKINKKARECLKMNYNIYNIRFGEKFLIAFVVFTSLYFVVIFALDFTLYSHNSVVWDLVSDSGRLYSVGADGTLKIWSESLALLNTITTHSSWVRCVALNNKYIAVGGYKPDNTVKIYEKSTLKLLHTLSAHKGSVFSLIFYKSYLISAGSDNTIIVWKDFKPFKTLKVHDGWVRKLVIFGDYLVSGDENGRLVFTSLGNFERIESFELKSQILSLYILKNTLYVGLSDGSMYKFEIDKGKLKYKKVLSLSSAIQSIDSDGSLLFASNEGKIYVFSLSLSLVRQIDISASEITAVKILNGYLFTANREGDIFKYSKDGKFLSKVPRHFFSSAKVFSSANILIVGREDGTIESFNQITGTVIWDYTNDSAIRFVVMLKEHAVAGTSSGKLLILKDGKIQSVFYNSDSMVSYGISRDGKSLYVGSLGKVFSLSLINGKWTLSKVFDVPGEWITAIYDDGKFLYIGTNIGRIYKFEKDNKKLSLLHSYPSTIVQILKLNKEIAFFHFDGNYVVYDGKVLKMYRTDVFPTYCTEISNGQLVVGGSKLIIGKESLEFEAPVLGLTKLENQSNTIFASLSNGVIVQIEDGKVVKRFSSKLSNISTLFADNIIVCGHEDGKVSIWKSEGGKTMLSMLLDDHSDSVKSVLRYGDLIISASNDRTIRIWDSKNGKLRSILVGHSGYVWRIFLINDILVSGGWDGKIILWDLKSYNKKSTYDVKYSITDIWAISKDEIYASTLEGFFVKIHNGKVYKTKLADNSLWTLDGIINKDGSVNIITAGWDGRLYVLNKELVKIREVKAHNSTIFKVIYYNDNVLTVGTDNLLKVWNKNFENIGVYSNFRQSVLSVALSKTLGKLVTTDGKNVSLIDLTEIIKK